MSHSLKIQSSGHRVVRADGQTDMTELTLILGFRRDVGNICDLLVYYVLCRVVIVYRLVGTDISSRNFGNELPHDTA
jgi:hypothetical protein